MLIQTKNVFGEPTKNDFDGGAALAVEAERAGNALANGKIHIRVGQDNGRVLGLQAQAAAQAVRARVRALQGIGGLRRADKGQNVNLAAARVWVSTYLLCVC